MAKTKITDYSTTRASNADIDNINIAEGCAAGNVNDAIREVMVQLAETNAGTYPVADTWTFADPADLTKRVRFDAGSITTGTTRVLTIPDANFTIQNPAAVSITGGTITGTSVGVGSPAAGNFTTLTASGAFTSLGIDDNATAETMQLTDSSLALGQGSGSFSAVRNTADSFLYLSGGTAATMGASIQLYGQSEASNALDIFMRSNSDNVYSWDDSADEHKWYSPAGTQAMSLASGTLTLTGGKIAFPATQSASADPNTLDDYEEGTWTPTLTFGAASVGMTGSFLGTYTKVGRLVTLFFRIVLTAKGSSTGLALIGGLPFSADSLNYIAGSVSFYSNMASIPTQMTLLGASTTTVQPRYQGGGGAVLSATTDVNYTNTSELRGVIHYNAA